MPIPFTLRLALVCTLTALAIPVLASEKRTLPEDVTDNSSITITEIRANSESVFDALSGPKNQSIKRYDLRDVDLPDYLVDGNLEQMVENLFLLLDSDADFQITYDEWHERIEADVSHADLNGDGEVTLIELSDAAE